MVLAFIIVASIFLIVFCLINSCKNAIEDPTKEAVYLNDSNKEEQSSTKDIMPDITVRD